MSDALNDRLELAERLCGLRRRWFELTRQLGAEPDPREQDRLIRELESIETEVRSAVVDVAKMLKSDDKEIVDLRVKLARATLEHQGSEAVIHMAIARMGGLVEGRPTHRGNFLQRIDELVRKEPRP